MMDGPLPNDPEYLPYQFDQAWRNGNPPDLDSFLPAASPGSRIIRGQLLQELIKIDLEYRWQAQPELRRRVEEYAALYAELGRDLSPELIVWEYRVRRCNGHHPNHAEYLSRFPRQAAELPALLARIDAELAAEIRSLIPTALPVAPEVPVCPSEPGQIVGPYVLLERLGGGGAGQVFKARHQKMDRLAAVKIIRPDLLTDPEMVRRFYREVEAISQFRHPHIVHAYDAGPAGATHFLAMEYLEGTDLSKLVKRSGPLPVDQAREYIRQTCLGLQYVHEHGMVHRDIKPSNLMLAQANGLQSVGMVKILDLGLVRFQRRGGISQTPTSVTKSNTMMGTMDYMAPEQAMDAHVVDIRADIYSLGCTLYYLLTGQPPFPGGTDAQKLVRHQLALPPALDEQRPDVPADLAGILRVMLAKEPVNRPPTPAVILEALAGNAAAIQAGPLPMALPLPIAADSLAVALPTAAPADDVTKKLLVSAAPAKPLNLSSSKRRRPWLAIAAAAMLTVAAGLLLLLFAAPRRPRPKKERIASRPIAKATEKEPTLLFADNFEKGILARSWRRPKSNNPWRIIPDPGGKRHVLDGGGPLPPAPPNTSWNLYRFDHSLQCGNATWTDYAVEVSVRFEANHAGAKNQNGPLILARTQDRDHWYWLEYFFSSDPWGDVPAGPILLLAKWKKTDENHYVLKASSAPRPEVGRWHRLRLEMRGDQLRGLIDDRQLVEARDGEYRSGGAGLVPQVLGRTGVLWSKFRVEKLPPK